MAGGERPVVVVTAADTDEGARHARALVGVARAVVLCGHDGARLGTLAGELRAGVRVAVFVADAGDAAAPLAELVAEMFVTEARDANLT